jgi:hypothetical protein
MKHLYEDKIKILNACRRHDVVVVLFQRDSKTVIGEELIRFF